MQMAEEDVRVATTESSMKNKVMVAIDDSEFSEYAFTWALKTLGSTLLDSELLIYTARTSVDISYLYASSWGSISLSLKFKTFENDNDSKFYFFSGYKFYFFFLVISASELIKELEESEKKASFDLLMKAKTTCENYGVPFHFYF